MPFVEGESVLWTNADDLDPRHTDPRYAEIAPQLYSLDAAPYENLMIGYFSIWQGPENNVRGALQKRNDILLGFSRDGFHWDRPYRERFISCTWDEKNWRYGNVQSVADGASHSPFRHDYFPGLIDMDLPGRGAKTQMGLSRSRQAGHDRRQRRKNNIGVLSMDSELSTQSKTWCSHQAGKALGLEERDCS